MLSPLDSGRLIIHSCVCTNISLIFCSEALFSILSTIFLMYNDCIRATGGLSGPSTLSLNMFVSTDAVMCDSESSLALSLCFR